MRSATRDPALPGGFNDVISIGNVAISPNDYVIADGGWVVVLAAGTAETPMAAGIERDRKESNIIAGLRLGDTTIDLLGLPDRFLVVPNTIAHAPHTPSIEVTTHEN